MCIETDPSGKAVAVLDIEGVNMSFMSGDPYILLKKTVGAANAHYPERYVLICLSVCLTSHLLIESNNRK